jgi:hypothetical protein
MEVISSFEILRYVGTVTEQTPFAVTLCSSNGTNCWFQVACRVTQSSRSCLEKFLVGNTQATPDIATPKKDGVRNSRPIYQSKPITYKLIFDPEGKKPIARPRRSWTDNIKIDLVEIGWGSVDWIGVVQGRDNLRALVNAVMNLWIQ